MNKITFSDFQLYHYLQLMLKAIISRDNLDKKYIITHNQDITGRELLKYIQQYSLLFNEEGFTKIGIYSENRQEWIYTFLSLIHI